MGYKGDALRGFSWLGGLRILTRAVALGRTVLLARILNPAQFGLFGIASLVLIFIETLTETGINIFLVQENKKINDYINTAWVVSIVRGIIIGVVIIIFAPLISSFFKSPDAYFLLLLISVVPIIRGFINPSIAIFQKDLLFRQEFKYRFIIFLVDSSVAIIAAIILQSAISIVLGLLVGAIVEVILSYLMIKPWPKLIFEIDRIKQVVNRGKWVTTSGIFSYLFHNGDDIIIGRIMNTSALGIYQVGYKISSLPITEIADVISRVVFPIYVKIGGDKDRLKKAFLRTLFLVSFVTIPIGGILYFFTEPLIIFVLGEKWREVIPIVQILALFGVIRAISGISTALFLAVKKQMYATIIMFVSLIALAVLVIPMTSNYGIIGAAYAVLISILFSLPFSAYYTWKILRSEPVVYSTSELVESKSQNE